MKNRFELIIFDWDGTLMDSQGHIVHCLGQALQAVGKPPVPAAERASVIGLGLFEALAALLPDADEQTIEAACDAFRKTFLSPGKTPSSLFEHVEPMLTGLHATGYHLAIATGKSRRGLNKVLEDTGLGELFAVTRCADETRSKPDPQMIEEILTDLDTAPDRAIMIGDTEFDLQMATNAGLASLGVSYGVHPVERLQRAKPLAIVDSAQEIGDWFGI